MTTHKALSQYMKLGAAFVAIGLWNPTEAFALLASPSGDTYVKSSVAKNQGKRRSLIVGAGGTATSLITFDLTNLPVGTTGTSVTKATVKIYTRKVTKGGEMKFMACLSPWD